MTLTEKDTNSILTDNTNRAIQSNVAMQVTKPGDQVCNLCKWCHLMANISTNASDLIETKNDVTLTDDNNSISTDDVNRAFIGNVSMQVATTSGQTCN